MRLLVVVQRLCNGLRLGLMLFQLLHRQLKPAPVDVEVPARGRQVRMAEELAHVVGGTPASSNRDPAS